MHSIGRLNGHGMVFSLYRTNIDAVFYRNLANMKQFHQEWSDSIYLSSVETKPMFSKWEQQILEHICVLPPSCRLPARRT